MLHNLKKSSLVFFIVLSTQLLAQTGPALPCVGCEHLTSKITPSTGFWYNPEQSGSGFSIEIKNRTIFGTYYGYDDKGKSIWFTFAGQLQPSTQAGVMWELEADLQEYRGGNSLNNEYQAPSIIEPEHQIYIKFNHMNHASFSVDDGPVQNIVPLAYGVGHEAYFPEQTSLKIPDLHGFWVFSFRVNTEVHPLPQYMISGFHSPYMIYLSEAFSELDDKGRSMVVFTVVELYGPPELGVINGGVGCYTSLDEDENLQGPMCYFFTIGNTGIKEYKMPIAGLGIDRLFGETDDGYTFKAFRYDYCDFYEEDIRYICEYDYSK
ncbi:hypothetical protein MNBD_GAMMA03-285 [hydrothermal vent metagenome]|uniref:Uncharacterized protein n=1 Tax=hydrothermal vent metagenome TaxID=652676 RepID=A0A3B0WZ41_9ZZZZ